MLLAALPAIRAALGDVEMCLAGHGTPPARAAALRAAGCSAASTSGPSATCWPGPTCSSPPRWPGRASASWCSRRSPPAPRWSPRICPPSSTCSDPGRTPAGWAVPAGRRGRPRRRRRRRAAGRRTPAAPRRPSHDPVRLGAGRPAIAQVYASGRSRIRRGGGARPARPGPAHLDRAGRRLDPPGSAGDRGVRLRRRDPGTLRVHQAAVAALAAATDGVPQPHRERAESDLSRRLRPRRPGGSAGRPRPGRPGPAAAQRRGGRGGADPTPGRAPRCAPSRWPSPEGHGWSRENYPGPWRRASGGHRSASYDVDRVWTVPNALSFLRLLGVPLVVWLILGPQADLLAAAVLVVAGFTDWLDGYLARAWNQRSRVGQLLDPVADRLYILAIIGSLAIRGIIPWWLVIVLAARDVMIALLVPLLQHPRLLRAARALPGQGRDVLSAVRLPAGAARRGRRHRAAGRPGGRLGVRAVGDRAVLVGRHPLRPADHRPARAVERVPA